MDGASGNAEDWKYEVSPERVAASWARLRTVKRMERRRERGLRVESVGCAGGGGDLSVMAEGRIILEMGRWNDIMFMFLRMCAGRGKCGQNRGDVGVGTYQGTGKVEADVEVRNAGGISAPRTGVKSSGMEALAERA